MALLRWNHASLLLAAVAVSVVGATFVTVLAGVALAAAAVGLFGIVPFVVRRQLRQPTAGAAALLPADAPVPDETREAWERVGERAAALGYRPFARLREPLAAQHAVRWIATWTRASGAGATLLAAGVVTGGGRRSGGRTLVTSLVTRLADGRQAETYVAEWPVLFESLASGPLLWLPEGTDLAAAERAHEALVAHWLAARPGVVAAHGAAADAPAAYRSHMRRLAGALIAEGYYRLDDAPGTIRATWRGTQHAAWRSVPPVRELRRRRARRLSGRHLARLGVPMPERPARRFVRPTLAQVAALATGLVLAGAGMAISLGAVSWVALGVCAARVVASRRGRRSSALEALAGGAAGVLAFPLAVAMLWGLWRGTPEAAPDAALFITRVVLEPAGLFTAGAALLAFGWPDATPVTTPSASSVRG